MKSNEITKIAEAVSASQAEHWNRVHGRMEGMLTSIGTLINCAIETKARLPVAKPPAPAHPPLCKDCKHAQRRVYFPWPTWQFARCLRPTTNNGDYYVSAAVGNYCSTERAAFSSDNMCNRKGQFFEPK